MKSLERVLLFLMLAAGLVLFVSSCHSVDVADWPYVTAEADAGAVDATSADDAADSGEAAVAQSQSPMDPLACDGALCDTTNYTACNIASHPEASKAARPISVLLVFAGLAVARRRPRRRSERAS